MKQSELRKIIKEELTSVLKEDIYSQADSQLLSQLVTAAEKVMEDLSQKGFKPREIFRLINNTIINNV